MKAIFTKQEGLKTVEECLASINCNFDAEKAPVKHQWGESYTLDGKQIVISEHSQTPEIIPGYALIRRGDNKIPLAINAQRYGLVQHRESLGFLNDLTVQNKIELYGATSTDHGAAVYVAVKTPNTVFFAPDNEIECFFTARNSLDRSGSIEFMCSPVHKKLQVMLTTLDSGIIKMRHTVHVKDRLAKAIQTVNKMQQVWDTHAEKFRWFQSLPMTDEDAKIYFAMLAESDEVGDDVPTRIQNVRDKLFDLYKNGIVSHIPSCRGNLLGGFIAALVFGDYYKTTRTSCIGRSEHDILVESRLTGAGARFKADSFACALRLLHLREKKLDPSNP